MSQKIDGTLPTSAALRSSSVSTKTSSAGSSDSSPVAAASGSDSLKLTGEASNLQALQRSLSQAPAVDTSRVQAVKDALASGGYSINPGTIANRMMDLNSQLSG